MHHFDFPLSLKAPITKPQRGDHLLRARHVESRQILTVQATRNARSAPGP
nr:hypothetical protein JVH1_8224 [Rhodococcus sp. JVH1]